MSTLERSLTSWVAAGLITPAQAQAIAKHEEQPAERSWVVFGISAIGVVALATGFLSMIAANWEDIPTPAKILVYLLILVGVLRASYQRLADHSVTRELLLTFAALWYLAGIGLVGQIYHLRGATWEAFGFWCALILPLALLARNRLNAHLWFIALALTVGAWVGSGVTGRTDEEARLIASASLPFILYALGVAGAGILPENFRNRSLTYAAYGLAALSVFAQFLWSNSWIEADRSKFVPIILSAILASVLSYLRFRRENPVLAVFAGVAVLVSCANFVAPIWFNADSQQVLGTFLFIFAWATAGAAAASAKRRRLFDICTAVIGLRLVWVYFEVFGSLAATGIGLVVSGVLILALAKFWVSKRDVLLNWLQPKAVAVGGQR